MQLKIVLLVALVLLIMFIANGVSKQYKEKCCFYNDLIEFLNSYELNIGFKKDKMVQLVTNFKCSSSTKMLFNSYLDFLKTGKSITTNALKIVEEDAEYILEVFNNLGHADYEQELKKINNHKEYFKKKLIDAEANKKKLCPLIIKLSFMFSLIVVLLLI